MTDPDTARRGTTVTIKSKQSESYANDGTWWVFHGSPKEIIEDIGSTFGIETEGLSLFDVSINAEQTVRGITNVTRTLGASVLSSGPAADSVDGNDVWSQAAAAKRGEPAQEEKPAVDPILSQIEGVTSVADLQQIWAENQQAFNTNASYMDAYKAKGRALSAG